MSEHMKIALLLGVCKWQIKTFTVKLKAKE